MEQRENGSSQEDRSIAVVGMGCRLPGDVDAPDALWRLLVEGRDVVGEPPPERAELRAPDTPPPGRPGTPVPRRGGYLRDVSGFDADFFGVSGREADVLDPQHRLLLEVAWEALEHAGMPPDRLGGTPTGVYVGLSYNDYMERLAGGPQELEGSILTNGHCVASGRISYLLGLQGPCVALDTACSSSLVALHLAYQALRTGECDTALAGGVTMMLRSRITQSFVRMGMLSPTGRCRTFDAAADGFVRGEGCGVVVLRRLSEAVRDGDRILAVVRGSAVNQDGRSDGLAAPSAAAQQALFREALAGAGVDPRDVGMIEAHGTGTPVGDPIEFASLAAVYGPGGNRCALGSVKTNLGHLEPAAGITGLIKAVLCLRNALIPPNLHFSRWNPAIDPAGTRFFVPGEPTPWPAPDTAPRLAAVSSFGFSGTNAHVVLEQAPEPRSRALLPTPRSDGAVGAEGTGAEGTGAEGAGAEGARAEGAGAEGAGEDPAPDVFLVAAGSRDVLPAAAERLADWLEGDGAAVPLRDVAHTLALRRSAGRGRLGVTAATRPELTGALRAFAAGQARPGVVSGAVGAEISRRPVWVFSGHGSQWAGMGRGLLEHEPAFAAALAEVDALIAAEAGFSVLDLVRSGAEVTGTGRVQPALFALQYALAATWRAHGVEPAAVVGHSMGEVAAAVVAGALSPADGVRVICRRSALLTRIAGAGAMANVHLDRAAAEAELEAEGAAAAVSVAVEAAPGQVVVAGDSAEVGRLVALWDARGVPARLIAVDIASHSPQVEPLLDELAAGLAELDPQRPGIPFYSTVLDEPRRVPDFDAAYWCANLRRPVRFAAAVRAAAADRHTVYVEVSPHPVVTRAVSESLTGLAGDPVVLPTLRRGEDERSVLRAQLAALHCAGVPVDWSVLYGDARLADVPPITFDRKRHWVDTVPAAGSGTGVNGPTLPGVHAEVPGDTVRHTWQGDAGTAAQPWLADHRVHGEPVLPGAAYYALALTAACEVFDAAPHEVEVADVRFRELLRLTERTEVSTTVVARGTDHAECEIFGRGEDGWVRHATATLRRLSDTPRPPSVPAPTLAWRHPLALEPDTLYTSLRARGLEHGPGFAILTDLRGSRHGDSYWARVRLPDAALDAHHGLRIHPVLVDACAQLAVAGLMAEEGHGLVLPVAVQAVRLFGDPADAVYCHARISESTADSVVGHVRLLDEAGRPVMGIVGLKFVRHAGQDTAGVDRWFLETGWQPAPRPAAGSAPAAGRSSPAAGRSSPAEQWLVLGEADGSADELADGLRAAGATADVLDLPRADGPLEALRDSLTERWDGPAGRPRGVVLLCAPPGADDDPTADALRRARRLLGTAQAMAAGGAEPPRLYAVTRGARSTAPGEPVDLAQSALRGVVRVLAYEHPELRATLVDTGRDADGLRMLVEELLAAGPEDEVALRGPSRQVARLDYAPLTDTERSAAAARPVRYGADGFRLRAGRLGDLDRLELAATGRREPGPGEVELRVRAAGLNFRDVLTAMGLLPSDGDVRYRIGFECAGVVTAVGAGVDHLRAGDPVLAVDLRGGAFGSFLTVPAGAVAPVPARLGPVAAAGLPVAFLTAWYALRHVGRLAAGERVLIHSATGGTGLAAIAVARRLGAEVLATAGSEAKRNHLRELGIRHVMDSRSLDFADRTRAATGSEGVDLVLNSLSGAAIGAGMRTLRPFGRFVELGVRDILADAPLGLAPFRENITLSAVDLIGLQRNRPEVFATVLREVLDEFADGRLMPLPCRTFPLSRATDAFRLMAGAGHIGKVVLTVPDEGTTTAVLPGGAPSVRPGGAYVVTGGLRGVGLAAARWLADRGAAHVVLNGRSRPSPAAERTIEELRAAGTRVTVALGDIAEPGTAEHLLNAAGVDGSTVRGIIHSAMVLDDAVITNVTDDQLARVWRPKVTGAWRLHEACAGQSLDWFVVFSSMASLLGNPGQGVYAAANSWLDGFAVWRSAQGLPTLAVNWGPWGQTGVATDFADRGYRTIPTEEGFEALGALLAHGRVQTGVIPGDPDSWILPSGRHSSLFGSFASAPEEDGAPGAGRASDVPTDLRSIATGLGRRAALEAYLSDHIRAVLRLGGTTLDPQTPLKSLGFDSLLAMELRARLESGLGVRLAANFVWKHPTLAALATGLAQHMGLELQNGEEGFAAGAGPSGGTEA
ncbi:type I polyketide synthase [Streptomyces sp. NPDC002055]|uniref:type I polyketide synthase n=1 Tax=Streptomyces sp. NPDC002055 TaxID=3154534 RepID=UPI0033319A4F